MSKAEQEMVKKREAAEAAWEDANEGKGEVGTRSLHFLKAQIREAGREGGYGLGGTKIWKGPPKLWTPWHREEAPKHA